MGIENEHKYYSVDESLLFHDKYGNQLQDIGAIDNDKNSINNINFRLAITKNRDGPNLRTFVTKYMPKGNYLVTDC